MLKSIAIFSSMFFCANVLLAENLYQACTSGIQAHKESTQETHFEMELREVTLLPETLLQALSNNLYIYEKLEARLERIRENREIINPAFYRTKALSSDILLISSSFGIRIPSPTQPAKNLANAFAELNGGELMVAYYTFHAQLLDSPRERYLNAWLSRHGIQEGASEFYKFNSFGLSKEDVLRSVQNHYSSLELKPDDFNMYSQVAQDLSALIFNVEQNVYLSRYVREAIENSKTRPLSHNDEIGDFFQSLLKSKL